MALNGVERAGDLEWPSARSPLTASSLRIAVPAPAVIPVVPDAGNDRPGGWRVRDSNIRPVIPLAEPPAPPPTSRSRLGIRLMWAVAWVALAAVFAIAFLVLIER